MTVLNFELADAGASLIQNSKLKIQSVLFTGWLLSAFPCRSGKRAAGRPDAMRRS
jgi:hypothetical protein